MWNLESTFNKQINPFSVMEKAEEFACALSLLNSRKVEYTNTVIALYQFKSNLAML